MSNLYAFQGQESDDEIKGDGNSVNYKYRMHDPRLGRFFAVDPLSYKFSYYSPYQFGANSVIMSVELEGLETSIQVNHTEGSIIINRNSQGKFEVTSIQLSIIGGDNWHTDYNNYQSRVLEKGGFVDVWCTNCDNYNGKRGGGAYVTILIAEDVVKQNIPYIVDGVDAVYEDVLVDDFLDTKVKNTKSATYATILSDSPSASFSSKANILIGNAQYEFKRSTGAEMDNSQVSLINVSAGSSISRSVLERQILSQFPNAKINITSNGTIEDVTITIAEMKKKIKIGTHIEKKKISDAIPPRIEMKSEEVPAVKVTP